MISVLTKRGVAATPRIVWRVGDSSYQRYGESPRNFFRGDSASTIWGIAEGDFLTI
jgi:hypothetical protein